MMATHGDRSTLLPCHNAEEDEEEDYVEVEVDEEELNGIADPVIRADDLEEFEEEVIGDAHSDSAGSDYTEVTYESDNGSRGTGISREEGDNDEISPSVVGGQRREPQSTGSGGRRASMIRVLKTDAQKQAECETEKLLAELDKARASRFQLLARQKSFAKREEKSSIRRQAEDAMAARIMSDRARYLRAEEDRLAEVQREAVEAAELEQAELENYTKEEDERRKRASEAEARLRAALEARRASEREEKERKRREEETLAETREEKRRMVEEISRVETLLEEKRKAKEVAQRKEIEEKQILKAQLRARKLAAKEEMSKLRNLEESAVDEREKRLAELRVQEEQERLATAERAKLIETEQLKALETAERLAAAKKLLELEEAEAYAIQLETERKKSSIAAERLAHSRRQLVAECSVFENAMKEGARIREEKAEKADAEEAKITLRAQSVVHDSTLSSVAGISDNAGGYEDKRAGPSIPAVTGVDGYAAQSASAIISSVANTEDVAVGEEKSCPGHVATNPPNEQERLVAEMAAIEKQLEEARKLAHVQKLANMKKSPRTPKKDLISKSPRSSATGSPLLSAFPTLPVLERKAVLAITPTLEKSAAAHPIQSSEPLADMSCGPYYTISQLRTKSVPGLDWPNREKYLTDADFIDALKVTREEYATWPKWKQTKAKRAAKLF